MGGPGAAPSWEFSVLGPLDIRCSAEPVRVTRPMSRGLLALLLARRNRCVPADQLIDELWQGAPPASAEGALRVHVAHLRDALGTTGDRERDSPVQFDNGGYCVTVQPGGLDVDRFEHAVREGRTALQHGAPVEATDLLGQALRLWRGRAYDEFEHFEPIRLEAVRLSELRLDAVELLADGHLAVDQPGSACELLAPEVRAHPLEERLVARLMLALYRSGRAPEALRVASRLREALDDELGVLPDPSIRELEDRIVIQAPDLDAPRRRAAREPDVVTRSTPFVGRRVEARALDDAWTKTRDGVVTVATVGGGAGIGKTALADQLVQRAGQEGARVLVGHCDPDPHADYEPFPHLVRQAIAQVAAPGLAPPLLGELRRLVPDVGDVLPPIPASATVAAGRHRLFAAVNLVLELCRAPLLLLIEDVHWAQSDALAMLRHVIREHSGSMMVVTTYRDEEVGVETPLGRALATGPLSDPDVKIGLRGLDVAEIKALLELLGHDDVGRADLGELTDLTSGNPLFVREVVRELGDAPRGGSLNDLAPDGIRTLVGHQLQRLSPQARETLTVAALLGARFSLSLLAATGRMSETEALSSVEEALATRLLVETDELDSFTFSHPLVRNVIYASIPTSRRARLHLRAGEVLAVSAEPGRWAEPARHFLAARPLAPPDGAARYARNAGDDASGRFAHGEAADWYRAALDAAGDGAIGTDERAGMLLALGISLERGGDREAARRTYLEAADAASAAGDDDLLADIAIAATPRYVTVDEFHGAHRELVDRALSGNTDETRRARLYSCAGSSRYYDDGADRPYVAKALLLARESETPEVQATGLHAYHRWLTHDPHAAEERTAMCRELVELCTRERLHERLGAASRDLLVNLLSLGRIEEFDRELEHLDELAAAHDIPADRYWASALRATRGLMQVADAETEGLVRAAHTLGTRLQQTDAEGTFILHMFTLRWQQDRTREITNGLVAPPRDQPSMAAGLALLASAFVAGGRPDDAREVLDRVLAGDAVAFPRDNMWLAATALVGGVAAAVGSSAQRSVCRRALDGLAEQWCLFGAGGAVFGTVHHWLGLLAAADGDEGRAAEHLGRACELAAAAGATYWADRARTEIDRVRAAAASR